MRGFVCIGLTAALLLGGCSADSQQESSDRPASVTDADAKLALQAASQIVNDYGKLLKSELVSAMNEGGPASAIAVCQVKAPELTKDFQMDKVFTINRVSERNRNPENAADSLQRSVLARFSDTAATQIEYYDLWTDDNGTIVYHYYRPIRTVALCMNCHGDPAKMDPQVREMLAKKYPQDQAIGYGENELRGMFVIDLYWPEARTEAQHIVAAD